VRRVITVIRVKRVRKWRRPSSEKNVLELDVLTVPLRRKGMNRGSSPSEPPISYFPIRFPHSSDTCSIYPQ
jgi:hypothetical protein